ncbi:4Fe-4S single cluster domain-containing protein [uncultured Clostridium sp.]|uniref:4Fe-4S single cluster domain-containing protein n=1 Tax=uncultured Clostridium sp. TaxID=59620 RepID=UPI00345CA1DD
MPFDAKAKKELFEALSKPYIEGITYTGGDPLFSSNIETITALAKEIREKFPDKTQWLYTGYLYEEIKDLCILKYLDVIVDGEYQEELRSPNQPWVGSSNQRVIYLKEAKK